MVGRTFAHPKADAVPTPAQSAQPSVAGRMFLAVVCGAFFGGVLSVIVAPDFAIAHLSPRSRKTHMGFSRGPMPG